MVFLRQMHININILIDHLIFDFIFFLFWELSDLHFPPRITLQPNAYCVFSHSNILVPFTSLYKSVVGYLTSFVHIQVGLTGVTSAPRMEWRVQWYLILKWPIKNIWVKFSERGGHSIAPILPIHCPENVWSKYSRKIAV